MWSVVEDEIEELGERHAGGRQGLPAAQGPQTTADPADKPWRLIRPATSSTPTLNSRPRLRNLLNQQCLLNEFQQ